MNQSSNRWTVSQVGPEQWRIEGPEPFGGLNADSREHAELVCALLDAAWPEPKQAGGRLPTDIVVGGAMSNSVRAYRASASASLEELLDAIRAERDKG